MTVRRVIFEAGERRGGAKHDPSPSARWALVEFGSPRETGWRVRLSAAALPFATFPAPDRSAGQPAPTFAPSPVRPAALVFFK